MAFQFTVDFDAKGLERRMMSDFGIGGDIQRQWSETVFYGSEPYMPKVTGTSINLAIAASVPLFADGKLFYPGAYFNYLWNGEKYVDPVTKAAGFLTEDGWKSRKGVAKIPSGEPLNYDQSANPLAGAKWVERAANDHKEEWVQSLQEYIKRK